MLRPFMNKYRMLFDVVFCICVFSVLIAAYIVGTFVLRHFFWYLAAVVTLSYRALLWLVLGTWPTPVVSRPEYIPRDLTVVVDGFGQPFGSEREVGGVRVNEFKHHPVSAATGSVARLRRRSRFVRVVESLLGEAPVTVGQLWKGRWVPDLPDPSLSHGANFILGIRAEGVRILGGGSVQTDKPKDGVYLVCELSDGSIEVVFPEIVGRLAAYAVFRDRDARLLSSLRLRALEMCKKAGLDGPTMHAAVLSTVRMVWRPSPQELRALGCAGEAQPYNPTLRFGSD